MKRKCPPGFTLVELLVALVIIGVLVSLAIPPAGGGLVKGQETGTLSNARQLHIATQSLELDNMTEGKPHGWPGSNSVSGSVSAWLAALQGGYLTKSDLKKVLAAPGKIPDNTFSAGSIAFFVYRVADVDDDNVVFLSTQNWDASQKQLPTASAPYGKKGFVLLRKSGDGAIFPGIMGTNTNVFATNQPPKLRD